MGDSEMERRDVYRTLGLDSGSDLQYFDLSSSGSSGPSNRVHTRGGRGRGRGRGQGRDRGAGRGRGSGRGGAREPPGRRVVGADAQTQQWDEDAQPPPLEPAGAGQANAHWFDTAVDAELRRLTEGGPVVTDWVPLSVRGWNRVRQSMTRRGTAGLLPAERNGRGERSGRRSSAGSGATSPRSTQDGEQSDDGAPPCTPRTRARRMRRAENSDDEWYEGEPRKQCWLCEYGDLRLPASVEDNGADSTHATMVQDILKDIEQNALQMGLVDACNLAARQWYHYVVVPYMAYLASMRARERVEHERMAVAAAAVAEQQRRATNGGAHHAEQRTVLHLPVPGRPDVVVAPRGAGVPATTATVTASHTNGVGSNDAAAAAPAPAAVATREDADDVGSTAASQASGPPAAEITGEIPVLSGHDFLVHCRDHCTTPAVDQLVWYKRLRQIADAGYKTMLEVRMNPDTGMEQVRMNLQVGKFVVDAMKLMQSFQDSLWTRSAAGADGSAGGGGGGGSGASARQRGARLPR